MRRLALLISLTLVSTSTYAAPKGAIRVKDGQVVAREGFYCGLVRKKWVPGRLVKNKFFYSHLAERKALLAKASKSSRRAKARLKRAAKELLVLHAERAPLCSGGPSVNAPTPTITATPTPSRNPLVFDFAGAVGLALGGPSTNSATSGVKAARALGAFSNLKKVDSSGHLSEAVKSGRASISRFLIAPNNKLYVLFQNRTDLEDTDAYAYGSGCLLAEVDPATGRPACIESDVQSLEWSNTSSPRNRPIQFDATGAIYYLARNTDGKLVLRKYWGGATTDLITDNAYIQDMLVLPDGTVVITGYTPSTGAQWVRRISPSGSLRNLVTSGLGNFLKMFPDGNIYFGFSVGDDWSVRRYLPALDQLDDQYWIARLTESSGISSAFRSEPFCKGTLFQANIGFCGSFGTRIITSHETLNGDVFVAAGFGADGLLMQYYPVLAQPQTAVKKVSGLLGLLNQLVIAGLNADNRYILTLYDT